MRINKVLAIALALVLSLGLCINGFAAVGYGPGTTTSTSGTSSRARTVWGPGTYSTTTSSIGAGAGTGTFIPETRTPLAGGSSTIRATPANLSARVAQAIRDTSFGSIRVALEGANPVSAAAIKDAFAQARNAGVSLTFFVDVRNSAGQLICRYYFDSGIASSLVNELNFSANNTAATNEATRAKFEALLGKGVYVVRLSQSGYTRPNINVALRLDYSDIGSNNFRFYAYNRSTGTYTELKTPNYWIDSANYMHVTVPVGNYDLVVTA